MRKKCAREEKRKLTKGGVTLDTLEKKIDIFEKAVEPWKIDKLRSNLFAIHPPSWKLEYRFRG